MDSEHEQQTRSRIKRIELYYAGAVDSAFKVLVRFCQEIRKFLETDSIENLSDIFHHLRGIIISYTDTDENEWENRSSELLKRAVSITKSYDKPIPEEMIGEFRQFSFELLNYIKENHFLEEEVFKRMAMDKIIKKQL